MIDTEQVIDWAARGYYRFPEGDQPVRVDEKYRPEWDQFANSLAFLKAGSFGREGEMWAQCRAAQSWQISGAYPYLIGHTASLSFLQNLHPLMSTMDDINASVEATECLAHSGLLSAVPALLSYVDTYRHESEYETVYWDIHILMNDGKSGFPTPTPEELKYEDVFQEFAQAVLGRVATLRDQLGTTSVRILRGKPLTMQDLVDTIRTAADSERKFDRWLRQIFEAMTGIDCTGFFRDHQLDPLGVHAILDDFEESGKVETFVTGCRYFFGHPVPDNLNGG